MSFFKTLKNFYNFWTSQGVAPLLRKQETRDLAKRIRMSNRLAFLVGILTLITLPMDFLNFGWSGLVAADLCFMVLYWSYPFLNTLSINKSFGRWALIFVLCLYLLLSDHILGPGSGVDYSFFAVAFAVMVIFGRGERPWRYSAMLLPVIALMISHWDDLKLYESVHHNGTEFFYLLQTMIAFLGVYWGAHYLDNANQEIKQILEARQAQLQEALKSAKMASFEWNSYKDKWQVSDGFSYLMQMPKAKYWSEKEFLAQIHEDDLHSFQKLFGDKHAGKELSLEFRLKNQHWLWLRGTFTQNTILGLLTDIHERKQSEMLLVQERERSATAAKFSSLGEMTGGIAHEINTPLSVILLQSNFMRSYLKSGNPDWKEVDASIEKIECTTQRIAKIVKSMRAVSRDTSDEKFENTPVSAFLEDVMNLCQERFKAGRVQFKVEVAPEVQNVDCQRVSISQVLLNLLNNAYDACSHLPNAWVELKVIKNNDHIELMVSDSGPGIDPKAKERLFQPFFTTKEVGKGTGLGLSIAKKISENHGGTLYLLPNSPHTCFVVRIPETQVSKQAAA